MTQTQSKSTLGKVVLSDVRIAFAHGLFTASQVQGQGKPAFSSSFLFPQSHAAFQLVQKAMLEVAEAKWPGKGREVVQSLIAGAKVCMRDGNSKPDIAGYPGNWFVSARSYTAPLVIDGKRNKLETSSGKPYSGSYVNASLSIWAQQNQHGRRINAQLMGVQFVRDGEPLAGGGPASVEDFGEIEESAKASSEFGDLFGTAA